MRVNSWVAAIMLIISSCADTSQQQEEDKDNMPATAINTNPAKGIWVLADYIDSIIIDKSIAKHRVKPLSWSALQVEVTDSGIICYGSINQGDFTKGNIQKGILLKEDVSGSDYYYTYDAANDKLMTLNIEDSSTGSYIRTSESFLYQDSGVFWQLEPKLHSFFVANAFAGTYVNIATNDTVVFDPKYSMSGLGEFNQYNINMFMGTSHPFNDGDHVTYYGDDIRAINYFEFKGDTLVLYSYKEHPKVGADSYVKDKEVMRLLKVK